MQFVYAQSWMCCTSKVRSSLQLLFNYKALLTKTYLITDQATLKSSLACVLLRSKRYSVLTGLSRLHSYRKEVNSTIIFLFLKENICCGYSLEAPRRDASNEHHSKCLNLEITKISHYFCSRKRDIQGYEQCLIRVHVKLSSMLPLLQWPL